MSWRDFWNRENSIYVNERHRTLHDDRVSRDLIALIGAPDWHVLDFGCGKASQANVVANHCAKLYLYDAAPSVVEGLRRRFAGSERVSVLADPQLAAIPDASLDLIVVNSVIQYMPSEEFESLLDSWRTKLKPAGRLVVADIIPPDASAVADTTALLKFAWEGGFLVAAGAGLVTTFFSDYRKLRSSIGLTRYSQEQMQDVLSKHGYSARRMPQNIGHNQGRLMFKGTPKSPPPLGEGDHAKHGGGGTGQVR